MVETAQSRRRVQVLASLPALRRSLGGRVLIQPIMCTILVVIAKVVLGQTPQMAFIENDYVIEQFVTKTAHPTLRNSVLPWALIARPHGCNSTGAQEFKHVLAEFLVAVEDDVVLVRAAGQCLTKLLNDPFAGWVLGAVEMEDFAPAVMDEKQAVQNPEIQCDDGEQIHPYNHLPVIVEEGPPALANVTVSTQTGQIARDRALG